MTDDPKHPAPDAGGFEVDHARSSRTPAGDDLCSDCGRPLGGEYYLARSARICGACRIRLQKDLPPGSGRGRVLKAVLLGLVAALLGGGLWPLFISLTSPMVGFVGILLGYLVGIAVQKGSGGRGGRRYQILALSLAYFGLATAYVGPVMVEMGKSKTRAGVERPVGTSPDRGPGEGKEAADGLRMLGRIALLYAGMAVVVGKEDPLTLLLLAFALWEAWKLNADIAGTVTGPFRLEADPAGRS